MNIRFAALGLGLFAMGATAQEESFPILFTNVHVFNGIDEERIENANVLVIGNLITEVSEEPLAAANARVIDGGGRTLMPGLIDMHWHSAFANIPQTVALSSDLAYHALVAARGNEAALLRGFTTVRDMGGNVFSLKRLTDDGTYAGPRIFPSGAPIGQTSGHSDYRAATSVPAQPDAQLIYIEQVGHMMIADGVPAVLQRVREALKLGATQIKVMAGGGVASSFDPLDVTQYTFEEMKAAVDAAAGWNTYVAVHVYTDAAAQQALEAGVRSIEHGHLFSEETLRMMARHEAFLSMQPFLNDEDAIPFPSGSPNQAKFEQVTAGTERVYELARAIGVKIVFGTDTLFDPELAAKQGKQLAKLGRWFTPVEALRQATSTAGELLALSGPRNPYPEGSLGVIRAGAYADLILVDGNPLDDLDLVADPAANFDLIMKDGVIHKNSL